MSKLQAVKGFQDVLPAQSSSLRQVEDTLKQVLTQYSYEEVRLPLVEKTALFSRAIGDVTDIVEKEMYSFNDRSDPPQSLTLRPEGTAGVVRAVLEHNLVRGDTPRLWYLGPMFRYERPQKGRYRQFNQLGVEVFGLAGPETDAELVQITAEFWRKLGLTSCLELQINCLGEPEERMAFKSALVDFLTEVKDKLDSDSQRRLQTNPLRILDSKDQATQDLLTQAPKLEAFLSEQTKAEFTELQSMLSALGIDFVINPNLVRGLDYYNKFVFEWVTTELGAQGTVCAGGRYDRLYDQLSGKPKEPPSTPAVGFAMGMERLMLLLEEKNLAPQRRLVDLFVVADPNQYQQALISSAKLRRSFPELIIRMGAKASFKSQFKRADQCGAAKVLIFGETELANNQVTVKELATGEQRTLSMDAFLTQSQSNPS